MSTEDTTTTSNTTNNETSSVSPSQDQPSESSTDTAVEDNNNNDVQEEEFPSEFICPILREPPQQGARFVIGANGKDVETYYVGESQRTRLVPTRTRWVDTPSRMHVVYRVHDCVILLVLSQDVL